MNCLLWIIVFNELYERTKHARAALFLDLEIEVGIYIKHHYTRTPFVMLKISTIKRLRYCIKRTVIEFVKFSYLDMSCNAP